MLCIFMCIVKNIGLPNQKDALYHHVIFLVDLWCNDAPFAPFPKLYALYVMLWLKVSLLWIVLVFQAIFIFFQKYEG